MCPTSRYASLHSYTHSILMHSHACMQSWLSGASPCACLMVDVEQGVLDSVKKQLKLDLTRNLQGPLDHLDTFSESPPPPTHTLSPHTAHTHTHTHTGKFEFLVNGEAEEKVLTFLSTEDAQLSDYKELIQSYQATVTDILSYHDTVWFDMFQLDCSDIKRGLCTVANGFASKLVQALTHKHLEDNTR